MPIEEYYTTSEAAEILGLAAGSVRDAVRRGAITVTRLAGRNLISAHELERYRKEVQGGQGWQTRKQAGYRPNEKQRPYQQRYYERRKAARQQQQPVEPEE
jgi:excisionase family DNA binding protein